MNIPFQSVACGQRITFGERCLVLPVCDYSLDKTNDCTKNGFFPRNVRDWNNLRESSL